MNNIDAEAPNFHTYINHWASNPSSHHTTDNERV